MIKSFFLLISIFIAVSSFSQKDTLVNNSTLLLASDSVEKISFNTLSNITDSILLKESNYYSEKEITQFINLKKEDLPELSDKEIELKLNQIETTLNIRFTADIGKQIRYLIYYNRNFIVDMLTKAEYYFPLYEKELDKLNVPLELKYVSVIESHLNPLARSPMGATGLWQFMYSTAKYKGMSISTLEDQRRDPIVSTQYAASYLLELYHIYNDWLLAISAYNAGAGNINKAIRATGGFKNYWIARPFMPRETQKYVPRIIAIMYAMYYAEDYMLFPRKPSIDYYNVDYINIPERMTIQYVSELLEVDSALLVNLNPMLIKNLIPSRLDSFRLIIPKSAKYTFIEKDTLFKNDPYLTAENKMLEEKSVSKYSYSGSGKYKTYTIQTGDNLGYIAQLFSCKVSDIKRWNGMSSNFLRVGKKLRIYSNKNVIVAHQSTGTIDKNVKVGFTKEEVNSTICNCAIHEIISGDNLWDISVKYKSSIEKIKSVNNIYPNWRLKLGTFLKIPN